MMRAPLHREAVPGRAGAFVCVRDYQEEVADALRWRACRRMWLRGQDA